MSKEKPIIFSTEMVRAILDGRKTQTRRVIKPQPKYELRLKDSRWHEYSENPLADSQVGSPWGHEYKCPWLIGDILWVRETWADLRGMGFGNDPKTDKPWNFAYKADIKPGSDSDRARIDYGVKWKPSIYMPREAARLFLRVKNVRVERLQDITRMDCQAEGFPLT